MDSEILIVGGGLAGLALARHLHAAGRDFRLIEARDRVGGRILSPEGFDLGPAWFWPGQPRIDALVTALGLERFDQHAAGALSFEDAQGRVERGRGFASMAGSWRLAGGLGRLTEALARALPPDRLHLSDPVVSLARGPDGLIARTASGARFRAARVVLALPPRLAAGLAFAPALPDAARRALADMPTWMAGQAKAVAVYDRPFWREAGLSGDAISHRGPMVEIHDASPMDGSSFALFGFLGVPPEARADPVRLEQALRDQLQRLFGPQAGTPLALHLKDWAADPFTATPADRQPMPAHPAYGPPAILDGLWDGRLIFGGSELAPRFGGYLEGALEAAGIALDRLEMETLT